MMINIAEWIPDEYILDLSFGCTKWEADGIKYSIEYLSNFDAIMLKAEKGSGCLVFDLENDKLAGFEIIHRFCSLQFYNDDKQQELFPCE